MALRWWSPFLRERRVAWTELAAREYMMFQVSFKWVSQISGVLNTPAARRMLTGEELFVQLGTFPRFPCILFGVVSPPQSPMVSAHCRPDIFLRESRLCQLVARQSALM